MKINAKHFEKLSKLNRALCGPSVLDLARFTGEPSIRQNDAPIYSWTSIKCQKFFGSSDLFSIFRFPFDFLSLAHFKRDATKSSLTLEIVHCLWVCLAADSIVCMLDYVNDFGPFPCHAPSVFGSQCGSQNVAHPLRRRHVSTLFDCRHAPSPPPSWQVIVDRVAMCCLTSNSHSYTHIHTLP